MGKRKHIIAALLLFVNQVILADTELRDPVTQKTISYHTISLDERLNSLNPFEDIDLSVPVIQNNKAVNESIKAFMKNILLDENYKKRFKDHAQQAIANFVNNSENSRTFSEYDRSTIIAQSVVLESLDSRLLYFYNNLICIQLESDYTINKQYNQFSQGAVMYQTIYVDVNTGKIMSLIDLCPKKLQPEFINILTRERNRIVPLINAQTEAREKEEADEDREYEEENGSDEEYDDGYDQPKKPSPKDIEEKLKKTKINLSDLIFDVNALNFFIKENASNTLYTKGNPYVLFIKEDSLNYYLPWTVNKNKGQFNVKADAKKINKKLLMYEQDYNFLNDQLKPAFESIKNKKTVTVYYRQKSLTDTTFKILQRINYTSDNKIAEISSDYNAENKDPNRIKKYFYEKGSLAKIEIQKDKEKTDYARYTYDKNGFLIKYASTSDNDRREHYYRYSDLSVSDCSIDEGGNDCYTILFDTTGNIISHSRKEETPRYINVYSNGLLMATGDMLYSYNSDRQLESVERDRGRYYTKYYYDTKKRLAMHVGYDGKQMSLKEVYGYDEENRLISIDKYTYSYGTIQTQMQYKIVYE